MLSENTEDEHVTGITLHSDQVHEVQILINLLIFVSVLLYHHKDALLILNN
jgi:hypothetical protein